MQYLNNAMFKIHVPKVSMKSLTENIQMSNVILSHSFVFLKKNVKRTNFNMPSKVLDIYNSVHHVDKLMTPKIHVLIVSQVNWKTLNDNLIHQTKLI